MVPLWAVAGKRERVVMREERDWGVFIPRLQKRVSQSGGERFWRGDWSMNIWWVKGEVVKSSA